MSISLKWQGHATWLIEFAGHRILVDPFFEANPAAPTKSTDIACDLILVTHGHEDHIADAVAIAVRNKATVVSVFEISQWLAGQGVEMALGMNLGGTMHWSQLAIKMVPALHSSTLPDGTPGGVAAGFVLAAEGRRIYIAGDTALFSDMQMIGALGIDIAILPIGDLFTMGIDDSVHATKLIQPRYVVPSHFNTWEPIRQAPEIWAQKIRTNTKAIPVVLNPGEAFRFDLPNN